MVSITIVNSILWARTELKILSNFIFTFLICFLSITLSYPELDMFHLLVVHLEYLCWVCYWSCKISIHHYLNPYFLQPKITETTLSKSFPVIAVPEGRQRPRLNKSSATSPPTILALYLFLFCPAFNP